jgi:hypothetical protein
MVALMVEIRVEKMVSLRVALKASMMAVTTGLLLVA